MTPAEFRAEITALGLTHQQAADMLRLQGSRAAQTVSDWCNGRRGVSPNPTACELIRAWKSGYRPADWPKP